MSGEMDRYFHSRRALKKRVDEQNAEITTLRGQIRDLQRTVAFFASVIKSGEGWTEQCDRAWPVTLEPCVHDFHRTEHGVMPCTKCGAEAHAAHIRALAPSPSSAAPFSFSEQLRQEAAERGEEWALSAAKEEP